MSFNLWMGILSCSLSNIERTPCTNAKECFDNFGTGYICSTEEDANGYCDLATPIAICSETIPANAYDNLNEYTLIGSIYESDLNNYMIESMNLAVHKVNEEIIRMNNSGEDTYPLFALIHCRVNTDDNLKESINFLRNELQIQAILGPFTSEKATEAFNYTDTINPTLFFSPSATSSILTDIDATTQDSVTLDKSDDEPGLFWRTVASDATQAKELSIHIDLNVQGGVYMFYDANDEYSTNFHGTMKEQFSEQYLNRPFFAIGFTDVTETNLSDLLTGNFDAVVLVSVDPEKTVLLIERLDTLFEMSNNRTIPNVYVTDASANQDFVDSVTALDTQITIQGSRPGLVSNIDAEEFLSELNGFLHPESDLTEVPTFAPYSYDAAYMTMLGLHWARQHSHEFNAMGLDDANNIARGLRHLVKLAGDSGETLYYNWSDDAWNNLTEKMDNSRTKSVDIYGVSGPLDYDLATEELETPIEIWTICNNEIAIVPCQD